MTCEACGNAGFRQTVVGKAFNVDGHLFWVEDIPAEVCERCGEVNFTAEVAERVRALVREPGRSTRMVQAELVRYHAA
jgi:YgiT-type zinc finger domain-containing protein